MNDLSDYTFSLPNESKILVIGCGLSGDFTLPKETIRNLLMNYKNITLSDYKYKKEIWSEVELKYSEIVQVFPNCKSVYEIKRFLKFSDSIGRLDEEMFFEKFKELDLLKDDLSKLDKYDYIELRYVLHLKCFKKKDKYRVIKGLYNKLNKGGSIGIQCYYELSNNNPTKDKNEHNLWNETDIEYLNREYSIVEQKYSDLGGKYYRIIISN